MHEFIKSNFQVQQNTYCILVEIKFDSALLTVKLHL